jgi:Flp pilus assembly protein TadG
MSRKAGSSRRSKAADNAIPADRLKPNEIAKVVSGLIRHLRSFRLLLGALRRDESGVTAILTALMMVMIFGFVGLGLDGAVWYTNHNQMQVIVDSAALGAAKMQSNSSNTTAMITAAAKNDAVINGLSTSTGDTISASVGSSPATVTVTMTRVMPTFFSALFLSPPTISATATAFPGNNVQVCILVLENPGTQTLLVNSGNTLTMPTCQIDVASTSSGAAMFDSSLPNVAGVCIAGTATLNGNTVNNLVDPCTVATDPFANTIPAPSIGTCINATNYAGTVNLSPGTYCGGGSNFNGSGTVTLAAGTYVFNGAYWNINSGWTLNGTGVTIYLVNTSSYIQIGSGVTVNLSAPTSGSYANVLMFEPNGLSAGSGFTINGSSSGHLLQGLIYLPSRDLTFNSTANVSSDGMTLVVNELILDSVDWSINPNAKNINAAGSSSVSVGLTN